VIAGEHSGFTGAQSAMTGLKDITYRPDPDAHATYDRLFALYRQLHDAFGTAGYRGKLANVMKDLIAIRNRVRKGRH